MDSQDIRRFRERFRRFRHVIGSHLDEVMCGFPITYRQCDVLLEIEKLRETSISVLSRELFLDKSTVSRVVDALVELGYITRTPKPDDRRCNILELTEAGREICRKVHEMGDACAIDVIERLPEDRRSEVVECFCILTDTMMRRFHEMLDEETSGGTGCDVEPE
jgi:MarR family 2-MHQ and catechol resistance regulon transcriptional repressor